MESTTVKVNGTFTEPCEHVEVTVLDDCRILVEIFFTEHCIDEVWNPTVQTSKSFSEFLSHVNDLTGADPRAVKAAVYESIDKVHAIYEREATHRCKVHNTITELFRLANKAWYWSHSEDESLFEMSDKVEEEIVAELEKYTSVKDLGDMLEQVYIAHREGSFAAIFDVYEDVHRAIRERLVEAIKEWKIK